MDSTNIKEIVKEKYGQAALRGTSGSCCGAAEPSGTSCDPITFESIRCGPNAAVPGEPYKLHSDCGNPTALAKLIRGSGA